MTTTNDYYQTLVSRIDEWSLDASGLLHGEAVLYPDFPPSEDAVWHHLSTASESDSTTLEILQIIFHAFSALLTRLLSDHLPGGVHDNPCTQLQGETKSVPKTNVISERDFGQLDRLLCVKPNASTLCNSYITGARDVWHLLHRSTRAHRARGLRAINAIHPEGV